MAEHDETRNRNGRRDATPRRWNSLDARIAHDVLLQVNIGYLTNRRSTVSAATVGAATAATVEAATVAAVEAATTAPMDAAGESMTRLRVHRRFEVRRACDTGSPTSRKAIHDSAVIESAERARSKSGLAVELGVADW
jgi:hypothetical protein